MSPRIAGPLVTLASITIALILAEAGYRIYLSSDSRLTYNAISNPIVAFDSLAGFTYVPGSQASALCIRNGIPRFHFDLRVGPHGDLGGGSGNWDSADVRILGFGDSFTADPFSYNSWTTYLAGELSTPEGKTAAVMNFGRDATGVLQMTRMAAQKVPLYRPDIAVVAFIMDDLSRARFWRTMRTVDGNTRLLTMPVADPAVDITVAEDVALIDLRIERGWGERIVAHNSPDDPLLKDLHRRYRELASENYRYGLWSLPTSFLYHRIVHSDPYFAARKPSHFPQFNARDLREDGGFSRDMRMLDSAGVRIVWIRIPTVTDLHAGRYTGSDQQEQLLGSLRACMGTSQVMVDLLPHMNLGGTPPDSLFLLPYDAHPSERGARAYAKAIASAIAPFLQSH